MAPPSHRLLSKAALAVEGRISIKQSANRLWPRDHARLRVLERRGALRWVGTQAGPHIGGTFAVWQITEQGRTHVARWAVPVASAAAPAFPGCEVLQATA